MKLNSYLLKFILCFCVLYYGTVAIIGISSPTGSFYLPFVSKYLNYVSGLRWLLLHSAKALLEIFGYPIVLKDIYTIQLQNGRGVHVVYSCIGYGVLSFWAAFIFANATLVNKKIGWLFGGLFAIFLVNVIRIALMLIAVNNNWPSLFNLDNHSWFTIAAYLVIFFLIYLFDRFEKAKSKPSANKNKIVG